MRRYTLNIFIALLTFVIGSFVVSDFVWEEGKYQPKEKDIKVLQNKTPSNEQAYYDFFSNENVKVIPEKSQEKAKNTPPFCRDKRILPVWKLLSKDEYFRERKPFRTLNCADMFEILYFDLNEDGKNEILLRGKGPDLCGAVGNCGFWIFEKKERKYRKILSDADFVDITEMGNQIRREKTNGYHTIMTKSHWNASDTRHSTFTFNGHKYIESSCLVDSYIRGTSPNAKWKFITCREHSKLESY